MGFGILLVGYLLLFAMRADTFRPDELINFLGYILCFIALRKLGVYNRSLRAAKYASLALLPVGLVIALYQGTVVLSLSGIGTPPEGLGQLHDALLTALPLLLIVFHAFLLWGIGSLAKEVELPKLQVAAVRNILIALLSYGLQFCFRLCDEPFGALSPYFEAPMQVLDYVRFLLCALTVFNCYRLICLPGDEDMPERDTVISRIAHRKEYKAKKAEENMTPEEKTAAQKAAYNEEMRRRQEERTKKNKRGKGKR